MNVVACFVLVLLTGQPGTPPPTIRPTWTRRINQHWCDQPTRNLRWLNRMIQNAKSWPPYHYGWEVHQARYRGQEVFMLSLCRYCGQQRGFMLYNHQGQLIRQDEGANSSLLTDLTNARLLAANPGRFTAGS